MRSSALIAAAAILLVGCASATPPSPTGSTDTANENIVVPNFDGPWAEDFASAYRDSRSDFERKALSDGSISDAEFAEMENRFKTCLESKGIPFSGFKPGGGYKFQYPSGMDSKKANTIADECSADSGLNTLGSLYFAMQRNPQNLDEPSIISACLVERQVVPKGYGASDYNKDAAEMTFPFTDEKRGQEELEACTADPLGMLDPTQ
ncbi:hypothetical protein [Plantibacter sp. YIM 135249]|uniref:hypothetical protein n=1 Tax=Plantibacter sp. YIM 135249 TaxID=3423918 RepID=UPI003D356190